MHARALVVTLTLLLVAATPHAYADWSVKGAFEPDTVFDLDSGLPLVPDRDPGGLHRIYFNGFAAAGGTVMTSVNPNLGTLRTAFAPAPFLPVAVFGIWRDCNGDGFMGLGDNGALEYRASLLLNLSICPPRTPEPAAPWLTHNDGAWVVEYVPIGYDDTTSAEDENPLNVNDTAARVWADWGLPADPPGLSCATTPAPYGSFRSTGGMLRWLDCFTGFRVAGAVTDAATRAGRPDLGFADAPPDRPDRSASPLNRQNPWGAEGDDALVTAFDCAQPIPLVVTDPTGALAFLTGPDGEVLSATIGAPTLELDPTGSPAGAVNATEAGVMDCDRSDTDEVVDLDGRRRGSDGDLPYALEGEQESVTPFGARTRTDHVFTFEEGVRDDAGALVLGARTREQAGAGTASLTGFWVGTGGGLGRNAFVSRQAIGPEPVTHLSFYAYADPGIIAQYGLLAPGGTRVYGSSGCAAGTFECDAERWWRNTNGDLVVPRDARLGARENDPTVPLDEPRTAIGVSVGQHYLMLDVDCYDSSAAAARSRGVHWGALTSTAC